MLLEHLVQHQLLAPLTQAVVGVVVLIMLHKNKVHQAVLAAVTTQISLPQVARVMLEVIAPLKDLTVVLPAALQIMGDQVVVDQQKRVTQTAQDTAATALALALQEQQHSTQVAVVVVLQI
jgi:hypothetical protein